MSNHAKAQNHITHIHFSGKKPGEMVAISWQI